jgi:Tfp pilus assembly protein PilO
MNIERDKARLWVLGGVAAAVVILALGWLLIASPVLAAIADTSAEIAEVETQNDIVAARNAVLESAEADRSMHESENAVALTRIPRLPQTAEFGDLLESYADQQSVSLTRYSTGAPEEVEADGRTTYRLPVSFTVRGGIDRVQNFLDQLQRTEARAMIVVSVEALPLDGQQDGTLEEAGSRIQPGDADKIEPDEDLYCAMLRATSDAGESIFPTDVDPSDEEYVATVTAFFEEVQALAPSELQESWGDVWSLVDALIRANGDLAALETDDVDAAAVQSASEAITLHATTTCGLTL